MSSISAFIQKNQAAELFAISGEALLQLEPEVSQIAKFDEAICAAAFSADDSELVVITADKAYRRYAYPSMELKEKLELDRKANIVAHRNGVWVVVNRFGIISPASDRSNQDAPVYTSIVSMPTSAEFNQQYMALTDRDGHVRLYDADLSLHKIHYCLNGHRSYVLGAKFLGKFVISASNDGSIKIWDTETINNDTGLKIHENYRMKDFARIYDIYGNDDHVCVLWQDKSAEKIVTRISKDLNIMSTQVINNAAKYYEFNNKTYIAAETAPTILIDSEEKNFVEIAGQKPNEQITAELLIKMQERGE